jgi:uncharacterized protein
MDAIDLRPFAAQVDGALDAGAPVVLATSTPDGHPDIALKGSFLVWDDQHLAFWERSANETLAALRRNPSVAAIAYKAGSGPPLRFDGQAQLVENGSVRDQIYTRVNPAEQSKDPERKGVGVLIRVDRVRRGRDVIQQRDSA